MMGLTRVICATMALASAPAVAQGQAGPPAPDAGVEIGASVLAHGVQIPFKPKAPAGMFYGRTVEDGTADVQLLVRSRPLPFALKPRLAAKVQVNLSGLTSFAAVGAEWRQHVLRDRVYGQIGIGLAVHDGYTNIPDPFDLTPGSADFYKRYDLYRSRTDFGSRVLFNPSFSAGVRLDRSWAIEAAWEHMSHGGLFARANDGIDTVGIRLIRTIRRK